MGKTIENETNDLISFDWETSQEGNFFGVEEIRTTDQEVIEEIKKTKVENLEEEITTEENKSKTKKNTEVEEDFFNKEVEVAETKVGTGAEDTYWGDIYKEYKDSGLIKHVELEEGEILTEERLSEIREEEYEIEMGERLKTWAQKDLDEDAQAFIKFKTTGGSTAEFFKAYSQGEDLPSGDITEEDTQDSIIRYQLNQEGWDNDEIEDRLEYLTTSGRKEKIAKKYSVRLEKAATDKKEVLLERAKANKITQLKQEEDYKDSIHEVLNKTKEVNGFKITTKDKTDLFTLLTKKDQIISDTKTITGFQKKLGEVFQDPEKMILLAKLVNSDFDMSGFKKATITKQTKEVKRNLEQRRSLRPSSSGGSYQGSSLAELF